MSKLQSAKGYFQKAREIQESGTKLMLEYRQQYVAASGEINSNKNLSEAGKFEAKKEVKRKLGVEFLQKSHTRKQEFLVNIKKAIRDADSVVYGTVKRPDDEKVRRFEADFRALKTELTFSPTAKRSFEKLTAFVDRIDDPYLAGIVRDQFGDITSGILAAPEGVQLKLQLARMFEGLKTNHETDEIREAREILEVAKANEERPTLYTAGVVHETAVDIFGAEYGRFIDKTEVFFESNADVKPADYDDPENPSMKKTVYYPFADKSAQ
ncbi:hypothetical protein ACFPYJ_17685 [Paenibacillus solisilvae]|uniref:Uncharacterized protein n=1 Tax=Paenibacillus solisilvae TaxID=2486751 RepID=A0ABW0W3A5_9BACL